MPMAVLQINLKFIAMKQSIKLMASMGQKCRQNTVGTACLCSVMSGPHLEDSKAETWNHLSLIHPHSGS